MTTESVHFGIMRIQTHEKLKKTYPVWSATPNCILTQCPAYHACPYDKEAAQKCQLILKYLRTCELMVVDNFYEQLDESQLFRIGMHLMPLYKQLVRLKIVEMGVTTLEDIGLRGQIKIHPVLKEIRETLRAIDQQWTLLGLDEKLKAPEIDDKGKVIDLNYYDRMEKESLKEQNDRLVRRRK